MIASGRRPWVTAAIIAAGLSALYQPVGSVRVVSRRDNQLDQANEWKESQPAEEDAENAGRRRRRSIQRRRRRSDPATMPEPSSETTPAPVERRRRRSSSDAVPSSSEWRRRRSSNDVVPEIPSSEAEPVPSDRRRRRSSSDATPEVPSTHTTPTQDGWRRRRSSSGRSSSETVDSESDRRRRRSGDTLRRRRRSHSSPGPPAPPPVPFDADAERLGPQCQRYLRMNGMSGPTDLYNRMHDYNETHRGSGNSYAWTMPCAINNTAQELWHPNPVSDIPGVPDTTHMSCQFGSISMHETFKHYTDGRGTENKRSLLQGSTCCGVKPHFNWVIGTCETGHHQEGQFCKSIPDCAKSGSPKINYIATYQYQVESHHFVMMDDSTAGDIRHEGVDGNYWEGTGFVGQNSSWSWKSGDWTMKYAPWARGKGHDGPRGVAPPAGLWVLSAENFYYGAFYMLHQLTLNLDGHDQPTDTNCWLWELDPVEGSVGWHREGTDGPGNLNMLYGTNNAQTSGCMPLSYTGRQMNGLRAEFSSPEMFRDYCAAHPREQGCEPWRYALEWSGGRPGSQRFEQYWDHPYVFVVVLDAKGSWTYRWIPREDGSTGWPGIGRYHASRWVERSPTPVTDPRGLATDVRGDVPEAVILQPALNSEESCLRSSPEEMNWAFGSETLGSMAFELGAQDRFAGAQNWWNYFIDTQQMADYPISIMGVEKHQVEDQTYTCNNEANWACNCMA